MRSIIDVDVNDSAFKEYRKSFDEYTKLVDKLPDDFAKQFKTLSKTKESFNELTAEMITQRFEAKQFAAAQKAADQLTGTMAKNWGAIGKSTKEVRKDLSSGADALMSWLKPASMLTGLLGVGGLLGLRELASTASANRRTAMGLGISYGENSAFPLSFNRFVNAPELLGNVAAAQFDFTSPGYTALRAAGFSEEDLRNHDAARISKDFLHQLPTIMQGTPEGLIGRRLHDLGLDNIISPFDTVRYLRASPSERAEQETQYEQTKNMLGVSQDIQKKWADLTTTLDTAGKQIETSLIVGLAPLAPELKELSAAFVSTTASFLESDGFRDLMKEIVKSLTTDLDDLNRIGNAFENVFKFLGLWDAKEQLGPVAPGASQIQVAPHGRRGFLDRIAGRNAEIEFRRRHINDVRDDGSRFSTDLSIGVRNNNPTNIGYGNWAIDHGAIGGSGWDTGHMVAKFDSYAAGMKAAEDLALAKYLKGAHSADELIAGEGGWTPGNFEAAKNVARNMGGASSDDLRLSDPQQMHAFIRALIQQEVGSGGSRYIDSHDKYQRPNNNHRIDIHNNTGSSLNISAAMLA